MNGPGADHQRKILPPIYLLMGIGLVFILDRFLPLAEFEWEGQKILGRALLMAGLVIIALPVLAFARARTGLVPFSEATFLVKTGFYRFSRNPMYLGMALMLAGGAVMAASLSPLLVPIMFIAVIQKRFIEGEERFLEQAFGEEYMNYKASVRRWL